MAFASPGAARELPDIPFLPPTRTWDPSLPAPCFYDWKEVFPFLEPLLGLTKPILDELIAFERRNPDGLFDWPEKTLWDQAKGESWRVLPFCHTFPAWDATQTQWVESAAIACPFTSALLKKVPNVRTALFSKMGPNTELVPHQGWADLSNHVLRVHLPLYVPALPAEMATKEGDSRCCGLQVEGKPSLCPGGTRYHRMGDFIVFDDSKMHMAFNKHPSEDRYVLIFDIARPEGLPLGDATGAMTGELSQLIDYFK